MKGNKKRPSEEDVEVIEVEEHPNFVPTPPRPQSMPVKKGYCGSNMKNILRRKSGLPSPLPRSTLLFFTC